MTTKLPWIHPIGVDARWNFRGRSVPHRHAVSIVQERRGESNAHATEADEIDLRGHIGKLK